MARLHQFKTFVSSFFIQAPFHPIHQVVIIVYYTMMIIRNQQQPYQIVLYTPIFMQS